jgi:cell division protein FtsZ
MAQGTIKEVLGDADLVFITAGMGGGTGTGAAPVVSKIANEMGAITVGMVTTPFAVERARIQKANEGITEFRKNADSVIILDNERLLDYVPNLPMGKAFSVLDQLIAETVKGITETITQPSLINLDYADMKAIMSEVGVAVMLFGESQDSNKAEEVVKNALNHPLLDVDYRGATGGLVHIIGGPDMSLSEANKIASGITERLQPGANVIWGARVNEEYNGRVRVMAIMTGVDQSEAFSAALKDADSVAPADGQNVPMSNSGNNSGGSRFDSIQ